MIQVRQEEIDGGIPGSSRDNPISLAMERTVGVFGQAIPIPGSGNVRIHGKRMSLGPEAYKWLLDFHGGKPVSPITLILPDQDDQRLVILTKTEYEAVLEKKRLREARTAPFRYRGRREDPNGILEILHPETRELCKRFQGDWRGNFTMASIYLHEQEWELGREVN